MASGAIEANCCGAIVNVLTAVIAGPTIDTNAGVATNGVETSATIMAGIWLHETLVDVLSTKLALREKNPQKNKWIRLFKDGIGQINEIIFIEV